ncbi:hypothetical protein FQN57_001752 [Myotisia sp. PD_48]|nr:hypothetical protein FQN57_001752 [Myotisia sp. PD_48]
MSRELRGACSCGRNQYLIAIPQGGASEAGVYFDAGHDSRRTQAAPLTAWLRVPLEWYQSITRSFFPDETHPSIRRTFVSPTDPHCRRIFCGFCGTPLSCWTDNPSQESEYLSVTVGSLFGADQSALEDMGLVPEDPDVESVGPVLVTPSSSTAQLASQEPQISVHHHSGTLHGIPWFEEMIEGSRLGRIGKRRRGAGGNHSVRVEWEISEWHDSSPNLTTTTTTTTTTTASETLSRADRLNNPRVSAKRKTPDMGETNM